MAETSDNSALDTDPLTSLTFLVDGVNVHTNPNLEEIEIVEGNVSGRGLQVESIRSTAVSDR